MLNPNGFDAIIRYADLADTSDRAIAQAFLDAGKDEGAIPADRPGFQGHEEAFIAWRNDQPIGCAVYFELQGEPSYWLDVLYVQPAFRRMKVADFLIDTLQRQANRNEIKQIRLGTMANNAPMLMLLRRRGYCEDPVRFFRSDISPWKKL